MIEYHQYGGIYNIIPLCTSNSINLVFSKSDVLEIVVVSELLSQGFQFKKVRGVLEFIHRNRHQLSADLYQTDGRTIWQRDLAGSENDHLINPDLPQQTVFLITPLRQLLKREGQPYIS